MITLDQMEDDTNKEIVAMQEATEAKMERAQREAAMKGLLVSRINE